MNKEPRPGIIWLAFILLVMLAGCARQKAPEIKMVQVIKQRQVPDCRQTCKGPDQLLPPLPLLRDQAVSQEISYIFFTDHLDRLSGAFLRDTTRDELRLQRVRKLYEEGSLKSWEDKYKAAYIFIHAGGPFARIDTRNYFIAGKLFQEVSHESNDPMVAAESAEMAEQALNKYVNASILLHRQKDEFAEDSYLPLVKIKLNNG